MIRPILNKNPYELWQERKSNIGFFHDFVCTCYALNNDKNNLDKFDSKSDEAIFWDIQLQAKHFEFLINEL